MAAVDSLVHRLFALLRQQGARHPGARPGAARCRGAAGGVAAAEAAEEARGFCEDEGGEGDAEIDEEGGAILAVTRIPAEQRERMLMMSAVVRRLARARVSDVRGGAPPG